MKPVTDITLLSIGKRRIFIEDTGGFTLGAAIALRPRIEGAIAFGFYALSIEQRR